MNLFREEVSSHLATYVKEEWQLNPEEADFQIPAPTLIVPFLCLPKCTASTR